MLIDHRNNKYNCSTSSSTLCYKKIELLKVSYAIEATDVDIGVLGALLNLMLRLKLHVNVFFR